METIFTKIEKAVKAAAIEGINYKRDYPMDFVCPSDELTEDETSDTITPMVKAMSVIMDTIKENATPDDNVRVCFTHLPSEEEWGISIGDGRI